MNKFKLLFATCLLFQASFSTASDESETAIKWLHKMVSAVQMLNYEGEFIYLHDKQLESLSIVHQYSAGVERERLVSLNGEAREILRQGSEVTCVWPETKSVIIEQGGLKKSFPSTFPMDLHSLDESYVFKFGPEDRVAGRAVHVVTIMPKDGFRYGFKLWLDDETALPLKSIRLDETNQAIEQIMYTSILVNTVIDDSKLKLQSMGRTYSWTINEATQNNEKKLTHWEVAKMPVGFILQRAKMVSIPHATDLVEHLIYTDGLATVSAYIESGVGAGPLTGSSNMGALSAYGVSKGHYFITVVGEVPAVTVKTIASSIARQ